jgi:methylated-DNA-protein-cysteine methyltransferase related protein
MQSASAKAADVPNFYAAVYRLVAQIPPGKVTTYGQIARWLGHPSAARAVGSDVPWQRVINAAGRVSSRCDRHYEGIQRALLEAEGVRFDSYGSVDLQRFGWPGPSMGEHDQPQAEAEGAGATPGVSAVQDVSGQSGQGTQLLAPRAQRPQRATMRGVAGAGQKSAATGSKAVLSGRSPVVPGNAPASEDLPAAR